MENLPSPVKFNMDELSQSVSFCANAANSERLCSVLCSSVYDLTFAIYRIVNVFLLCLTIQQSYYSLCSRPLCAINSI
jgi:hypothetical protein